MKPIFFQEAGETDNEDPPENDFEEPEPPQTRMSTRSKTRLASKRSKKRAIAKVSKPKKLKIEADYSEIEIESTFEPLQIDEDFVPERKTGITKTAWYCRFADCNRGDGGRPFTNRKNRNDHEAWYFDFLTNLLPV